MKMEWLYFLFLSTSIYTVSTQSVVNYAVNSSRNVFDQLQTLSLQAYFDVEKEFFTLFKDIDGGKDEFLLKFLDLFGKNISSSAECDWQLATVVYELRKGELWALSMVDAIGKPGSGITRGNLIWPGNFKLCYNVTYTYKIKHKTYPMTLRGKYFMAYFNLSLKGTPMDMPGVPIPPLQLGLCVPDSCSPQQIAGILKIIQDIPIINKHVNLTEIRPISNENNFWKDKSAVAALIVCFVFAAIIGLGTAFDMYLRYFKFNQTKLDVFAPKLLPKRIPIHEEVPQNNGQVGEHNGIAVDNISISSNLSDNSMVITNYELQMYRQQPVNLGLCGRLVLAFSLRRNAYNLFDLKISENRLACLNGIRVITMIWLILAQTLVSGALLVDNFKDILDITKEMVFQVVVQSFMSIDTFFVLSGLLVTYHYFKQREENDGKISWIKFYFHRYWRLTPLYVFILFLFFSNLIKYYTVGPFWPPKDFDTDNCKTHWWWNMLYINNYTPSKYMCMMDSWFLATEVQFYVISPLFLIPLAQCFPVAAVFGGIFLLASWITSGLISAHNKLGAAIDILKLYPYSDSYYNALDQYYFKPYCHIGAYIVGIFCGYLLVRTKCQAKINKVWVVLGWLLSTVCNCLLVFGLYKANEYLSDTMQAAYNALARTAWSISIAWTIFACANGYGGAINYILSFPTWQPMARLTYCVYLIHSMVINTVFYSADVVAHFSYQLMLFYAVAITAVCYLLAGGLSLVFEVPFLELEKAFRKR